MWQGGTEGVDHICHRHVSNVLCRTARHVPGADSRERCRCRYSVMSWCRSESHTQISALQPVTHTLLFLSLPCFLMSRLPPKWHRRKILLESTWHKKNLLTAPVSVWNHCATGIWSWLLKTEVIVSNERWSVGEPDKKDCCLSGLLGVKKRVTSDRPIKQLFACILDYSPEIVDVSPPEQDDIAWDYVLVPVRTLRDIPEIRKHETVVAKREKTSDSDWHSDKLRLSHDLQRRQVRLHLTSPVVWLQVNAHTHRSGVSPTCCHTGDNEQHGNLSLLCIYLFI